MTDAQEADLLHIQQIFNIALDRKYRQGQAAHGGNLWDRDCLADMGQEVLDMVAYYHHSVQQRTRLIHEVKKLIETCSNGFSPVPPDVQAQLTVVQELLKKFKD
jgi:hypothetical protein